MLRCPRCRSDNIGVSPSGDYVCLSCGNSWKIPSPEASWMEAEADKIRKLGELVEAAKREPVCEKLLEMLADTKIPEVEKRRFVKQVLKQVLPLLKLIDESSYELALREMERCL